MDSLALWIGMLTAALAAAAALWLPDRRTALAALTVAMLLAPVLIAADNWNSKQFLDLRDSPALLAVAAALGAALIAAGAAILVRHPRLLPLALIAVLPFRIPLDFGGSSANLLLPLYAVLAAGLVAAWVRPERVFAEAPSGRSRLIAAISPLLGLLGTVIGMVKVFTAITTHGVGDATVLAGGIAEALITTAAGLTVAIPALIGYRYYRTRVDTLVVDMEKEAIKLVEALQRRSEKGRK